MARVFFSLHRFNSPVEILFQTDFSVCFSFDSKYTVSSLSILSLNLAFSSQHNNVKKKDLFFIYIPKSYDLCILLINGQPTLKSMLTIGNALLKHQKH